LCTLLKGRKIINLYHKFTKKNLQKKDSICFLNFVSDISKQIILFILWFIYLYLKAGDEGKYVLKIIFLQSIVTLGVVGEFEKKPNHARYCTFFRIFRTLWQIKPSGISVKIQKFDKTISFFLLYKLTIFWLCFYTKMWDYTFPLNNNICTWIKLFSFFLKKNISIRLNIFIYNKNLIILKQILFTW